MKDVVAVLSVRRYKAGYEVRTEEVLTHFEDKPKGHSFVMKMAYTPAGEYIGDSRWAHRLCKKRGIKPEKRQLDHSVCSIGWCEKEQKWYGWSHRAIYGFAVGSECKKGDCHYQPTNEANFLKDEVRFWKDENRIRVIGIEATEDDILGVYVEWVYSEKIKNKKLRGVINGTFIPYPEVFGKGEWKAETLEDAKQMAMDFAEGVS